MRRFVRWHLWALVWLTIAQSLFEFTRYVADPSGIWLRYVPFTIRVLAPPFLLGSAQVVLWFTCYRRGGTVARIAAAFAGATFALIVLVQYRSASIDAPLNATVTGLYAYAAFAHLLYAVVGSTPRP